ncbi:hypothetical protein HBI16_251470 [Parastagonospora nodorum]|nr:hypothetical protein HBI16_251470 [Parastagonospora nodorum]
MLDFMQDMLDDIYPSKQKAIIQQLIAVVSPLFVLKAPFALHFICAVCDLVILAQYKNIRIYRALDSICTRANSEAHYITIVKQFYSMTNKKEYILQICLYNSQRTVLLAADYATIVKQTVVFQFSSKRYNDPKHCNEEVLHLILIIIDYTYYDKDRKHMAYIRAFSKNAAPKRWTLQAFKFYDLSMIICLVHLVPRDLPNLTTHEYNCLYSLIFNINLLRTLREYQRKRIQNN